VVSPAVRIAIHTMKHDPTVLYARMGRNIKVDRVKSSA
jgi:hypothetical protein